MVMETIDKVVANLGASDIDPRLEEQLIDGILYAFQEQTSDDSQVMLSGFGTVINALGARCKPYLPQIAGTIKVIFSLLIITLSSFFLFSLFCFLVWEVDKWCCMQKHQHRTTTTTSSFQVLGLTYEQ